jgi:hypothetical protein
VKYLLMNLPQPNFLFLPAYWLYFFYSFFLPLPPALASQPFGNSAPIATAKGKGVLDEIQMTGNALKARGWAISSDSANWVTGIRLMVDGVEIYSGGFKKQQRSDVAQAKGRPDWLESGWVIEATLTNPLPDGPRKIEAIALLENGERFDLWVPKELIPVVSSTPLASQELMGHLDEAVIWGGQLKVRGWVAISDPSQKIRTILLQSGDEILYRGKFQIEERPDVAAALGKSELLHTGWVIRLDWGGKPSPSSISTHFEMQTGEIIRLPVPVGASSQASVAPSSAQSNPILTRVAWLAAILLAGLAGRLAYKKFQYPRTPFFVEPDAPAPFQQVASKSFPYNFLLIVLFAAAVFLKAPHQFANPQFWAEDGVVFFQGAQELGFDSLFVPYAGYFHLIPRLVAYLATFFPIVSAPIIYLYSSYFILLGIGWGYLQLASTDLTRFFLIGSIVLVPIQGEVFLNLTNLQWLIAPFILAYFFIDAPSRLVFRFLLTMGLFCVCLTGPFSIFFAPFVAVFLLIQKITVYRFINFLILCSGALVQAIALLNSPRLDKSFSSFELFNNMVFINFLGPLLLGKDIAQISSAMSYIVGGLFLVWIIICILKLRKKDVLVSTCLFVLAFALLFLGFQASDKNFESSAFTIDQRYFYIPSILLIWLSGLLISRVHKLGFLGVAWFVLIGISALSSYSSPPLVDYKWSETIRDSNRSEIIPINPPNWKISIPLNEK